jgi:hypothetical protein
MLGGDCPIQSMRLPGHLVRSTSSMEELSPDDVLSEAPPIAMDIPMAF